MTKKSGLADNPLFHNPSVSHVDTSTSPTETVVENKQPPINLNADDPLQDARVNGRSPERLNMRTDERVNPRSPERPHARTGERPIVRRSYNVYVDQHTELQRIEAEGKLSGKPVFMSELVRQALDQFLKRYN